MLDINRVYCGDCVEVMKQLDDGCIDLTVTSPPYDNLRTYGGDLQWDFEATAKELWRVTKKGGVVVWVVGDATIKGSETGTSFRQALGFMEVGFNLHDTMIYHKKAVGACGSNRAYWQAFEYMFVFSKGKNKTFNPIRDLISKTAGKPTRYTKGAKSNTEGYNLETHIKISPESSARQNVWTFDIGFGAGDTKGKNHPAVFPYQLAQDHIQSWSNPSDLILDPFAGSGTTGLAAKSLNRNYLLIERNPQYIPIILNRLEQEVPT